MTSDTLQKIHIGAAHVRIKREVEIYGTSIQAHAALADNNP